MDTFIYNKHVNLVHFHLPIYTHPPQYVTKICCITSVTLIITIHHSSTVCLGHFAWLCLELLDSSARVNYHSSGGLRLYCVLTCTRSNQLNLKSLVPFIFVTWELTSNHSMNKSVSVWVYVHAWERERGEGGREDFSEHKIACSNRLVKSLALM
jgi:hypothetical protein